MTLCIAAGCQDRGAPRIVTATDWKIGTDIAAAETQDKLFWVDDNICALLAGEWSRATELFDCYRQYFKELKEKEPPVEITSYNIDDLIREPLQIYLEKRAQEHVAMKFGLSYRLFMEAVGKKQIPRPTAVETYSEIADLAKKAFECELIIATFVERESYIYRVDKNGIEPCDNFATIGSGATIAEGSLYQRQHELSSPIGPTIYRVFEAMKLGSIAPTVGTEHTINILYPPRKDATVRDMMDDLKDSTRKFLDRKFREYGPKPFKILPLPKDPFERSP